MARTACIIVVAIVASMISNSFVAAQGNRTSQQRQPRSNLVRPVEKRQPKQAILPPKLTPELEVLLDKWESESARVKTLEGQHTRITYDTVFFVSRKSKGKFFYESPDKGRIDLIGDNSIKKDMRVQRLNPRTRKKEEFDLKPDRSEMWICDGTKVTQVDVAAKQGTEFVIPPEQRGPNIMNGPLPFVFGMKAEAAKKRYYFKLVQRDQKQQSVWLVIYPRKASDAANWKSAQVILSTKTYLPIYVQLLDPAGTKETIFKFEDIAVNRRGNVFRDFFKGKPFQPRLIGYNIKQFQPQGVVPNVIGLHWTKAKDILKKAGFDTEKMIKSKQIQFKRGAPTERDKLVHVVYLQKPAAKSVLLKGQTIELTLYTKTKQAAARANRGQNNVAQNNAVRKPVRNTRSSR